MPRFNYKAYAANGSLLTGEISAASRTIALEVLARGGQVPVELTESGAAQSIPWWQREVFDGGRLKTAQLASFTRELASLAKAELPVDDVLRIVAVQPQIPSRLKRIAEALSDRVREGQSLSDALAAQGEAFPEFYWRLVKAGEASGALAPTLEELAILLERSAEVRAETTSSLVYPAILVAAAVAAIAVITSVLIPVLMPIFEDAKIAPPVLMRWLALLHDTIVTNSTALLALAAAAAALLVAAFNSEAARSAIDRVMLRLPVVGRYIRERETARFARTFSVLTKNGVPVLDAVVTAGGVLSNRVFRETVHEAGSAIREGGTLSQTLLRSGLFPDLFLRLAVVGEETGHLDTMHLRAAEIYEASQKRQVQRLTAMITPVLTLIIGLGVGGLILSVMGAILSINELAVQ